MDKATQTPKQKVELNYLRIAPRKVRLVCGLIRGLQVNEAEAQLLSMRNRAAKPVLKLLRSAVANIKNNKRLSEEKFFVETLMVDGGPMLKRSLPRARGMATPIHKIMSHITMILAENQNLKAPRFKIVVEKKTKLPPGKDEGTVRRQKPEKPQRGVDQEGAKSQKTGFFKKLFQRKSGFAK